MSPTRVDYSLSQVLNKWFEFIYFIFSSPSTILLDDACASFGGRYNTVHTYVLTHYGTVLKATVLRKSCLRHATSLASNEPVQQEAICATSYKFD